MKFQRQKLKFYPEDEEKMQHMDIEERIEYIGWLKKNQRYVIEEGEAHYMRKDNFYKEENQKEIDAALHRIKETEVYLDKVRGSLFGGAVGDALG